MTDMAPSDSKAAFLRIPWLAQEINRDDIISRVPGSRIPKATGEDTLFGDILKTPRTIRSCLSFYVKPTPTQEKIEEVKTIMTIGDGVNGHPDIMHGGIVATIIDEAMGILQATNSERDRFNQLRPGSAEGQLPPEEDSSFTAELKIKYLKPVMTSAPLMVTARYTKRDGRKEWIFAEVKQRVGVEEDYYGDEVICATGEALFIAKRRTTSKL